MLFVIVLGITTLCQSTLIEEELAAHVVAVALRVSVTYAAIRLI